MDKFPLVLSDPDAFGKVRPQELQAGQNLAAETALYNLIQQVYLAQQGDMQNLASLLYLLSSGSPGQVLIANPAAAWGISWSDADLCCEGRLTLTSGSPRPTADVASSSNILFTPYLGNKISLYGNVYGGSSSWATISFSETTIALSGLTAGTLYDLFAYNNAGTLAFDAPLAWASTIARSTGIVFQNGRYVKSGDPTRLYIGTFRALTATTTCDTTASSVVNVSTSTGRFVWNYFNRLRASMWTQPTASSSSTSLAVLSTTGNNYVIGVVEDAVTHYQIGFASNGTAGDGGLIFTIVNGSQPSMAFAAEFVSTAISNPQNISNSFSVPPGNPGYVFTQVKGSTLTGGTATFTVAIVDDFWN